MRWLPGVFLSCRYALNIMLPARAATAARVVRFAWWRTTSPYRLSPAIGLALCPDPDTQAGELE